jgi:hypothetical protein
MYVEIWDICIGNAPRKRNKEEKLTFMRHRKEMLRQKLLKMEYPS